MKISSYIIKQIPYEGSEICLGQNLTKNFLEISIYSSSVSSIDDTDVSCG